MKQFFVIAFRNLIAHRTRTLILGGAIALVTTMVTVMLALTSGIKTRMIENATALSTGHINVGGFLKISQSSAAPIVTKAAEIEKLLRANIPEATLIVDRVRAYGKIISDDNTIMVPISGIDMSKEKSILGHLALADKSDYIDAFKAQDGEARVAGNLLEMESPGGLVLFASHAKKLKVRIGDTVTISMPTYRNIYNTKDVKVSAILKNLGMISSFTVFMHSSDVREIYDMAADTTGVFQIYVKSLDQVPAIEDRIRKLLSDNKFSLMDKDSNPYWMKFERVAGESWSGQKLDITSWEDETSFLKWVVDIFNALTIALTVILMTIVVIGLINNLWMSVRERTSEIGTMRAIGLQRRNVLQMFVFECFILSVSSVGAGLLFGSLIALFLNALSIPVNSEAFVMFLMSNSLWLNLRFVDLFGTFVALCSLLMIGAFFPAYRASKMKPITAINHVN